MTRAGDDAVGHAPTSGWGPRFAGAYPDPLAGESGAYDR